MVGVGGSVTKKALSGTAALAIISAGLPDGVRFFVTSHDRSMLLDQGFVVASVGLCGTFFLGLFLAHVTRQVMPVWLAVCALIGALLAVTLSRPSSSAPIGLSAAHSAISVLVIVFAVLTVTSGWPSERR